METFFIDPIAKAQEKGIIVRPSFGLDDGINGLIKKENGTIVIEYDASQHEHRTRFTIAHELGHYILGHLEEKTLYRDANKNFNIDNFDLKEAAANKYAAELLMPKEKLEWLIFTKGITDIDQLSNMFNVSSMALSYRLKNLGFIN